MFCLATKVLWVTFTLLKIEFIAHNGLVHYFIGGTVRWRVIPFAKTHLFIAFGVFV